MDYEVYNTGSKANQVGIEDMIIDCGVPIKDFHFDRLLRSEEEFDYKKALKGEIKYDVTGVLHVTHTHSDHCNGAVIKVCVRLGIPVYVHKRNRLRKKMNPLHKIKVNDRDLWEEINWYEDGYTFENDTKSYHIILTEEVPHNVPNHGIHLWITDKETNETTKVFYCTDMGDLLGVTAPKYDYYFLEANYDAYKLREIRQNLRLRKQYDRFARSVNEHFSKQQCRKFYYANKGEHSQLITLHKSENAY